MKISAGRRTFWIGVVIGGMVAILGSLDVFLRSYNEIAGTVAPDGIKTRIGDYVSRKPMGTLPVHLIWALWKWPDRSACLADPGQDLLKWGTFNNDNDVEVCLTRVLTEAKTVEAAKRILAENGFSSPIVSADVRPEKGMTTLSASCGKADMPCGSAAENLGSLLMTPYGFTVSVVQSGEQVVEVNVIPSVL